MQKYSEIDTLYHMSTTITSMLLIIYNPNIFKIGYGWIKNIFLIFILGIHIVGIYYMILQYIHYQNDIYWNIINSFHSFISIGIPAILSFTVIHASQFGKKIGFIPIIFVTVLNLILYIDHTFLLDRYLYVFEYLLYWYVPYRYLYS
ncbi:Transmembrane domain-containing protein [Orpheovirus IHUMI-LCC2]|uniref:Transmembrane domain-containing protein n=1 Tax=Orpheovirus IHUMI-LCC2 TaxID=2023057 RepID=A0A2I2L457_9VIRU|nr:Transmembrane domain-containing protein [Orpheovirus IHUMI-LCC2]SNW62335.1 Transmembrane domain-containing protein [Orpheovirus IHUMI-LCC2]